MTEEILNSELMNEEQLNEVVGGTRGELSCDTKFLYALGLMDNYHEPGYVENHVDEVAGEVSSALKKIGIDVKVFYSSNGANGYLVTRYFPGGPAEFQFTDRSAMYQIVCDAVDKPDFDYKKYL